MPGVNPAESEEFKMGTMTIATLSPISGVLTTELGDIPNWEDGITMVIAMDSEYQTYRAAYRGTELIGIYDEDDQPVDAIIEED